MNKATRIGFFVLFALLASGLYATTPKTERVYIENKLNKKFSVYCEFLHKDGTTTADFPYNWNQTIVGREVSCFSLFETGKKETFKSEGTLNIVNYHPHLSTAGPVFIETLRILDTMPLEEKLAALFKVFTITDEDGTVLLTLDTISKAKVELDDNIYTIILDESLYE